MRYLASNWPSRRSTSADLFDEMERMLEDFNLSSSRQSFERSFNPAVDVTEDETHFLMCIDLPGIKKEDVHIEMQQNVLTISGERKSTSRFNEGKQGQRVERSYGSFTRSFSLPTTVSADKIEAHYEDGVLNLYLPKTPIEKSKKIEIKSEKSGGFFDKFLGNTRDSKTTSREEKPSTDPH